MRNMDNHHEEHRAENIRSQVQSVAGKWVNVAVAHAGDEYVLSKYPWGEA